ncbi:hypothetical protein [Amycolatopsis sp. NPDC051071]|uniref:hypothetical protein n=1 Tax=Amycolatopsis sp. NPDC051071 TaxID=3154637 RepID=UPI0034240BBD
MISLLVLAIVAVTALVALLISAKYKRSLKFGFLGIKIESKADRSPEEPVSDTAQ